MLDNLKSAFDNFLERITNPFGGTLIAAWLIHNWELSYSFFTFDSDCTLNDRLVILHSYLSKTDYLDLIVLPIWYTFLAIIVYQFLNIIAKGIIIFFARIFKPALTKLSDKSLIYVKSEVEPLFADVDLLQKKNTEAREQLTKALSENDKLKEQNQELLLTNNKMAVEASNETKQLKTEVEKRISEINKLKNNAEAIKNKTAQSLLSYENIMGKNRIHSLDTLEELFPGKWLNHYIFKDGQDGTEVVQIKNKTEYYLDGNHVFNITDIISMPNRKYIQFTKNGIGNDKRVAINYLIQVNEFTFVGTEDNETNITYSKISENKPQLS